MLSVRSRSPAFAGVAQLAEQLICNHQVAGSIPAASTFYIKGEIVNINKKFSIRTSNEEAELIRLAYTSFKNKCMIIHPETTPPSMNRFLTDLLVDGIIKDLETC